MALTTSYITPIMDRTQDDVYYARLHQNDLINKNKGAWNYTDANRVCNNLKYAAEYMYEQGFLQTPYQFSIKTNWTESDIITYEQINSMIINHMNNLHTYSRPDLEWYPISSIINMNYITANELERNIHNLATQEPLPPDTFELIVENGSGSGSYEARTVVTIRANTPEAGMVFSHWSGDHLENIGSATSAITTYEMPNSNVRLTANYTSNIPHTLTVVTNTATNTYNLSMGDISYIEADPAPLGKVFHHWNVEPNTYERNLYEQAASTHFTMPNEAITLTAVYITTGKKHLIVTNGSGSGWYDYDTYVPISPSVPSGSTFTKWTRDTQYLTSDSTQAYNSIRIPDVSTIRITANWSTPPTPPATGINLTVVNGVITSTGETTGTFTEGNRISITANEAPSGQVFSGWSKTGGGSISNSGSMTATVTIGTSDTNVTATYRTLEYHTLTVTTNSGTATSQKEKYQWFSINANPLPQGYTFNKWTGDTSGLEVYDASTGSTMGASDRTITATYRPIESHTLTVHLLSGDVTYTQPEFSAIRIVADAAPTGMEFTNWSMSGYGSISSSTTGTTTYTFGNGDGELTPNYVNIWTVSVVGGTIDGSISKTLRQGYSYRLNCESLAVYERFDGWTQTGPGTIRNTASTSTYFTVGEGDATITANISEYPDKTLTVYARDPDTGTDTLISSTTYRYGTTIPEIVAPIASDKTTFLTWLGDDTSINALYPSALASTVSIRGITTDVTIIATYFYPESPEYYMLTVYNGSPSGQTYAVGTQVPIRADLPAQGYEFYKWYGDTQYLVDQSDLTNPENSVIIPRKAITLYAKYNLIGELPLFRITVSNGTASGTYTTGEGSEEITHNESGAVIDVPAGTEITLTADPDVTGHVFDHWEGNFEAAGVDDIVVTNNPTIFTMVENDLNIQVIRRELDKYELHTTNASGAGTYYPGSYPIAGNLIDTDTIHYSFNYWTCVDADGNDCISAIGGDPYSVETYVTITDKSLWVEAVYTSHYRLTVIGGQDTGDKYYYENEIINSVRANTPGSRMLFDHWDDPMGVITTNIYDPTPTIKMKNSPATVTAIFASIDTAGNSVAITGNDLHTGIIRRSTTNLINGIYAVGTITFDGDGCIGAITEINPDQDDNTDDYRVQKLFYGGNV